MAAPAGRNAAPSAKPAAPKGRPAPSRGGRGAAAPNPLLDPNATLSGKSLLQAAQNLAAVQTNPAVTDLQKQIASNNTQTQGTISQTGGFYNQLEPFVQQGATQSGNIASGLNSTLQGIGQNTQSQLAGFGQNAQASLLKYAPQGEGGIANAATSDLAAQIARQQGLAAQQAGTYQSFGATQGANNQQFANSQLGTFGLQGQEALRGIAQSGTVRNEPLVSKIAGLRANEGALTATDLGKLRQQEVANQISRQGLGLKTQSLNQTAANDNARNRLAAANDKTRNQLTANAQKIALNGQQLAAMRADRTYKLDLQKFGAAQAKDAYERAHGLGPYKPAATPKVPATTPTGQRALTPDKQQLLFGDINTIQKSLLPEMQQPLTAAAATSLQGAGYNVQAGQRLSGAQIRQLLASGMHPGGNVRYDPAIIDAAFALHGWGYLTNKQITELNKMGLIVGNRYARAPTTVGAGISGAPSASGGIL